MGATTLSSGNRDILTWSEKPAASEFGVGQAWFSDIGAMGYSDGLRWHLSISGHNRLLNTEPTVRVKPVNTVGSATYSAVGLAGSSTIAASIEKKDIGNGYGCAKITVPGGEVGTNEVRWNGIETPFTLEDNDIWLVPLHIDEDYYDGVSPTITVTLRWYSDAVPGSNYREFTFDTASVHSGWNVLCVKHTEVYMAEGGVVYGSVGTTLAGQWTNAGTTTSASTVRSVRVRITNAPGRTMYLGSVFTAPPTYAKAAIIWGFDDVKKASYTLAAPILEEYGYRAVWNAVSGYTGSNDPAYINLTEYRDLVARGHEIWGHTSKHEDLPTLSLADKRLSLGGCADFFNSVGLSPAGKFLAYPFGRNDAETRTVMAEEGYKLGRGTSGRFHQSWRPGINPYNISAFPTERTNSWECDTAINGAILRRQAVFLYLHEANEGGTGIDTSPAGGFYTEHLRRWCNLIKAYESAGLVEVFTPLQYFAACGINPLVDDLTI
jgi:peptidoglycan/xylan/chitin deacetylase (PgdA/CDA1 family)